MAENELLRSLTERLGVELLELPLVLDELLLLGVLLLLLHAAIRSAALTAAAVSPALLVTEYNEFHLARRRGLARTCAKQIRTDGHWGASGGCWRTSI